MLGLKSYASLVPQRHYVGKTIELRPYFLLPGKATANFFEPSLTLPPSFLIR